MLNSDIKKILIIAIPAALNNLLDMLQVLVDMIFVGRISPVAIAAVGLSMNFLWVIYAFITIFSVSTNALVARFFGAKDFQNLEKVISVNLVLALIFSIFIAIFVIISAYDFFFLFGKDKQLTESATDYMHIQAIAFPFLFAGAVFASTSNGFGDTKTPLLIGIAGNILNTFLDYCLVLGNLGFPRLEILGASIATTIADIFEVLIYIFLIFYKNLFKISFSFSKDIAKRSLKLGIPTGIERFVSSISFMFFIWIIAQYGTYVLAGYQIGLRVEGLAFMIGFGFSIAAMTLVGQSIGEGNLDKAYRLGIKSAIISGLIMQFIGIFMFFYPEIFISIFTQDPKTVKEASLYLKVVAVSQFPLAIDFVLSGALRGAGATKIAMFVNTGSLWLFRIIPSLILTLLFKNLIYVYLIIIAETFIKAFIIWYIFKKGKWKKIEG